MAADAKKVSGRKKRKSGPKGGRPPFEPTDEHRFQVEMAVGLGIKQDAIAQLIVNPETGKGISRTTLQEHFADEIARGRPKLEAMIGRTLVEKAMGDDKSAVTAAIWLTKAQFGWRGEDKLVHEIDANTGVLVAPAMMAPSEWIAQQQEKNGKRKGPEDRD